jgi:phage shock protein C
MVQAFTLDRPNGKVMGVCAGMSRATGWNVTLVRLALVLLTLCALGPIGVVTYLIAGWAANR